MTETSFNFSDVIREGDVLACGDIHGCYDQFAQFLDWVKGSGARVILLGDLLDRGPNDLGVLEIVRDLIQDPDSWGLESFISLRGNHETIFLNAVDGFGWTDWVRNGGDWENFEKLKPHAEWLRELPYFAKVGNTLFTHSGGIYGENPQKFMHSETLREEFVWSRHASRNGSGLVLWSNTLTRSVFGHTPRKDGKPYEVGNSICVDSGCYFSGVLTAYNSTQHTFKSFTLPG